MMIQAVCRSLGSGVVKSKLLDLPGVPRVGEQLEVETIAGMVMFRAVRVCWRERAPIMVDFCPMPTAMTPLADVILDQDGWRRDDKM